MAQNGLVLVGDDLAEGGAEALRQALERIGASGGSLDVVHAIPEPGPIESLMGTLDDASARNLRDLEQQAHIALADRVRRISGRSDISSRVVLGSPHRVLLHEAESRKAALVVVGASSSSRATTILLGSSAAQVVRHAPCSVLVTRATRPVELVVVATDLSDPDLPELQQGIHEAAHHNAKLVVLHVLDLAHPLLSGLEPGLVVDAVSAAKLEQSCQTTLAAALDRFGGVGTVEVIQGNPKRSIVQAARDLGAGLVVVGTHDRRHWRHLAFGSVAERVLGTAPCSVLVARTAP